VSSCIFSFSAIFQRFLPGSPSWFAAARAVCFQLGVSSISASLIVATLQLAQVQSVLGAIHRADVASGKEFGAAGILLVPEADFAPREVVHPTPRYEPREVIHPTPIYEQRPIFHTTPPRGLEGPAAGGCVKQCPVKESTPLLTAGPAAPWDLPLPLRHSSARRDVKVVVFRSDTKSKGNLIDLFV